MRENVILAYYAQILKFGPRLPKMEFFKKFLLFWKSLQILLLTSPQPPADIKFKSSYARKYIIKKVESTTPTSQPLVEELPVLHLIRGLWYVYMYIKHVARGILGFSIIISKSKKFKIF